MYATECIVRKRSERPLGVSSSYSWQQNLSVPSNFARFLKFLINSLSLVFHDHKVLWPSTCESDASQTSFPVLPVLMICHPCVPICPSPFKWCQRLVHAKNPGPEPHWTPAWPPHPRICLSHNQRITNTRKLVQVKTGKILIGYKNFLTQTHKGHSRKLLILEVFENLQEENKLGSSWMVRHLPAWRRRNWSRI
jgi:hypothetical protein